MITKKLGDDVYIFDETEHKHFLNCVPLVGVTTCLKVINPVVFDDEGNVSSKTDMLMSWAVKLDVEAFAARAEEYVNAKLKKDKDAIISEVKRTHRQTRDKAGSHGHDVHGLLERVIAGEKPEIPEELKKQVDFALGAIAGYKVIRNEGHVWSKKHLYGGIFDLLLKKDGKFYVADFKTSKSVHDEFFVQMAAYDMAIQEMIPGKCPISGYIIIHVPASGDCAIYTNDGAGITCKTAREAFVHALAIYRLTYGWAKNKMEKNK